MSESKEQEYKVYCNITNENWKAYIKSDNELVCIEGTESQSDELRNSLQAHLEILQFLRKWYQKGTFLLYTNNLYSITCMNKWIPNWIQKGFRIGHTATLRPNTDLLVKLHSFSSCMSFHFIQHYDVYDEYVTLFT
jgi:hypothetical protein